MKVLFVAAEHPKKIVISKETINYLKKLNLKQLRIFCSAQFCQQIKEIENQLNAEGIKTFSSIPKRASCRGQLLGCDVFEDSLNLKKSAVEEGREAYLYIGDGKFHPLALAYGQVYGQIKEDQEGWKKVICYNPLSERRSIIEKEEIINTIRKYKSGILRFIQAGEIGVIISTKWGQEQYKNAKRIEKKYPDKRFYFFLDDNISFDQLENFPFIEAWVNTACPRVALDGIDRFNKAVINLKDAFEPLRSLEKIEKFLNGRN